MQYTGVMKKHDLLAVGGVYVDITATDVPFGRDGLEIEAELTGSSYEVVAGGSAPNFTRLCTVLGLSTVMIGKVGDDETGQLLKKLLLDSGIHSQLIVDSTVSTNIGLNLVNDDGQAMMLSVGTANMALTAQEVLQHAEPLLADVTYLYLGSCLKLKRLLPTYETLAEHAQASNTRIIVDHGRLNVTTTEQDRAMVRELVRHANYYFPSRDEFLELWNADSIESGLLSRDWGHTQVIVKDGIRGAIALAGNTLVNVPAYLVKPVNTVGAGDSFNAGVIVALNDGANLEAAMKYGCATAALKISQPGLPDISAIAIQMSS